MAEASVQSITGSRGVRISGSNAGYTRFGGSEMGTGYPLNWPVSPSLPLPTSPCAITFRLDSTQNYFTLPSTVQAQAGSPLNDTNLSLILNLFVSFSFKCVI